MTYQLAECIANKQSRGLGLKLDVFCNINTNNVFIPLIILESNIYDEGVYVREGFVRSFFLSDMCAIITEME